MLLTHTHTHMHNHHCMKHLHQACLLKSNQHQPNVSVVGVGVEEVAGNQNSIIINEGTTLITTVCRSLYLTGRDKLLVVTVS